MLPCCHERVAPPSGPTATSHIVKAQLFLGLFVSIVFITLYDNWRGSVIYGARGPGLSLLILGLFLGLFWALLPSDHRFLANGTISIGQARRCELGKEPPGDAGPRRKPQPTRKPVNRSERQAQPRQPTPDCKTAKVQNCQNTCQRRRVLFGAP